MADERSHLYSQMVIVAMKLSSSIKRKATSAILGMMFLFGGAITGLAISPAQAETGGCSYLYCHEPSGNCLANQNATKCMSSTGQLPCEASEPCYGG